MQLRLNFMAGEILKRISLHKEVLIPVSDSGLILEVKLVERSIRQELILVWRWLSEVIRRRSLFNLNSLFLKYWRSWIHQRILKGWARLDFSVERTVEEYSSEGSLDWGMLYGVSTTCGAHTCTCTNYANGISVVATDPSCWVTLVVVPIA